LHILLAFDLHYTLPQLDWVVRRAPACDLVVIAGDSLDIASEVPLEAQALVILRYVSLLQAATRVAVISGNHDLTGPDARLAVEAARRPARWLWVYHWPPLGSPSCWTGRRRYGDTELGAWIARHRPNMVRRGHVHEPTFRPAGAWADRIGTTWAFNPGRQIGPVPAHIEIDLDAGGGPWRWASSRSTWGTTASPGASPYWCFRPARQVVTKFRRSASPRATAQAMSGWLASSARPPAAWGSRLGALALVVAP
jgi:hypothetical protein